MTRLIVRILLSTALVGSMVLAGATGAWAGDDRRERGPWTHERWEHDRRHDGPDRPDHVVRERYVEEPVRVVYQRPVVVMPSPVYLAPVHQAPIYVPPAEPSLNFNITIPLR